MEAEKEREERNCFDGNIFSSSSPLASSSGFLSVYVTAYIYRKTLQER